MNILYVAHEGNLGGATKSMLGIIDEMIRNGHNVYVILPHIKGELLKELKNRNVTLIQGRYYSWMSGSTNLISKTKGIIKFLLNYMFIVRTNKKIKSFNIEVIHSNTITNYVGSELARRNKIHHIWHIREFGDKDHNLHFIFNQKKCLKYINNFSDKIIFVSYALYSYYKDAFDKEKSIVIYNGIAQELLIRKKYILKNEVNLLISGSLQKGKGQKEAIYALINLLQRGVLNIKLYIAGRGNESYKNELEELVRDNNVENYVEFLNYIQDIQALREKMDIELVCSKSEAFGRVTVEAMMTGNPVIASNTGANPELVKHRFNGLLYELGNVEDLSQKIEYFIKNINDIERMGKNAYHFVKYKFTVQENASQIEKIYLNLTNSKK